MSGQSSSSEFAGKHGKKSHSQERQIQPDSQNYCCTENMCLDKIPLPALITDCRGRITHANQAVAEYFKMPLKFLCNRKPLSALVAAESQGSFFQIIHPQTIESECEIKTELLFCSRDGLQKNALATVSWRANHWGADSTGLWIIQNASLETALHRKIQYIETKLESYAKELSEAHLQSLNNEKVRKEQVAQFAHELRTPLQPILSAAEMLLDADLNSTQKRMVSVILASIHQALTVANSSLSLLRTEQRQEGCEHAEFDLHEIIDLILRQFASQAKAKGITISANIDALLPERIVGDCSKLNQILCNLVNNSMKFTECGGIRIDVQKFDQQNKLLFTVSDTGCGIEEALVDKLFEPFSEVCLTGSKLKGGAGLGFHICNCLVKSLGGHISVESTVNSGTRVMFTMPLILATESKSLDFSPPPIKTPPQSKRPHVLLAEDNQLVAEVLSIQLRRLGCEVLRVDNGASAVDLTCKEHFDVIFMDSQMPIMGGCAAARQIRSVAESKSKDTPIVGLSANLDDSEACLSAGMNYFLGKPAALPSLQRLLETALAC